MTDDTLLSQLQTFLQNGAPDNDDPDLIFSALLPLLGKLLLCDRCFLYLRNPQTNVGKITHCWRRSSQFPDLIDVDWKQEPGSLPGEDPLFAAALQAKPSIFIEDVETANPHVVNRAFEQNNFGHRALIHAHLCQDNHLWGILQPCIFQHPRTWTSFDRAIITLVEKAITPLAITYITRV